jgi:hypothetical protein
VRFAPHCGQVQVLQPTTGLDDCATACHRSEPHCIMQVSVDQVVAAARLMLREVRTSRLHPPWPALPTLAAQRLLHSHSVDAMQRAIEGLGTKSVRPTPSA